MLNASGRRPRLPRGSGARTGSDYQYRAEAIAQFRSNEGAIDADRLVIENESRRVTPNIPEKARNTIQGNPAVVVATVDQRGCGGGSDDFAILRQVRPQAARRGNPPERRESEWICDLNSPERTRVWWLEADEKGQLQRAELLALQQQDNRLNLKKLSLGPEIR
jgi:hypothetical protein